MGDSEIDEARELLSAMVAIPSVTIRPGAEGPGESALSTWMAAWFREQGLEAEIPEAVPGRNNVVARVPGRDRSWTLLLNSHLDTVEVEGMTVDPFHASIEGTRLHGRGACDAKGCLATFMLATRRAARASQPPPVDLLFVAGVGEEAGNHGIRAFVESLRPDHGIAGCVIGEPTELRMVLAQKGGCVLEITTEGKAAHSSQPWQGDNAIYRMTRVVDFVEHTLVPETEAAGRHPLVGTASLAVTTIRGGIGANVIPPSCTADVFRRTIPGEDPVAVRRDLERRIEALDPGHIHIAARDILAAVATSASEPLARDLGEALERRGLDGRGIGVHYGTDGLLLEPFGIPVVVFGPGSIDVAHQADEWVDLREVATAADVVTDLIAGFTG